MTPRLYIFDADGTLRRTRVAGQPCPHAADEWELLPDVRARLRQLPSSALFAVASNQDHVGYGHLSYELAHQLLTVMIETASDRPVIPAAVQLCPHRLEQPCDCRKPAPGLLYRALAAYSMPPEAALFVGDQASDAACAAAAAVPFAFAHHFFHRR